MRTAQHFTGFTVELASTGPGGLALGQAATTCENRNHIHPSDDPRLYMPDLPSGTVTFLFTDIEGSTALWERDRATMQEAVVRQFAILNGLIEAYHGVLYKKVGDAAQAAFASAEDALRAAVATQRALLQETWADPPGPLRVRMALHAGEAAPDDRGDYLAAPLNRLARVLAVGHGGQIVLTQTVQQLTRGALPAGATLRDLGDLRLRDLLEPERVFQLLHPDLPTEFPAITSLGSYPTNLPHPPTPFLGRERELEEIEALLQTSARLVTLTGPGGVGKTRLGLQVASEELKSFPHGAFLIDLAGTADPGLVPSVAATALGLREHPGQSLTQTLIGFLRDKQMLLLFDNFEHLMPAATLLAELLSSTSDLKILVTSRARLGLQAEQEYPLETLPFPKLGQLPPLTDLAHNEAIALFVDRARALRPDFALTAENAAAVAAICARVDGLPLAIELAAARIKLMPPQTLLERLERRLTTLTGGARDLPARQRTLRDTIAWSYDLLSPTEKLLFRSLSVFAGGWTLEGAEAIGAATRGEIDAIETLASLIDQSLADELQRPDPVGGEPRYVMLETIREFASEQLAASGEAEPLERAFEVFLIDFATEAEQGLNGPDQPRWLSRLEAEHDNLRAALDRSLNRGDGVAASRLAMRLWEFWLIQGYWREGRDWLERTLAMAELSDIAERAAIEFGLGKLRIALGDYDAAEGHFRQSLETRRQLGDAPGEARVLRALAIVALNRLAFDEARALGENALAIARDTGDRHGVATGLYILGMIAREEGQFAPALALFEESLALGRALGDVAWIANVTSNIGITHRYAGNAEQAGRCLEASRELQSSLGDRHALAEIASHSGHLAFDAGDVDRAVDLYATALRDFDAVGDAEGSVEAIEWLAVTAVARGQAVQALRLFGGAEAAREAIRLPPRFESDEGRFTAGLDRAMRAAGTGATETLAAGRTLSLERTRDEALALTSVAAEPSRGYG